MNYLVKHRMELVFICENCFDTITMRVPLTGTKIDDYCCSAKYKAVTENGKVLFLGQVPKDTLVEKIKKSMGE